MHKLILILFPLFALLCGCAKIVTPVGGPKDVTPPSIVKELPANGTSHFNSRVIKITFDEFVTLENTHENVLISPPLSAEPTYTLNGKTLSIKFSDTLQADQTYNIGFAGCICDYTEGNPIPFYNYAFSTGVAVDSFMLKGKITDAITCTGAKDFYVFAYNQNIDSLPLTTRPQYISKTQSDGSFIIKNIKAGAYKIFALKDINNNLLFDLPDEEIAFEEEMVQAVPIASDSAQKDSSPPIALSSFLEKDTTQSFLKMQNKEFGKYEFFYKNEITDYQLNVISGKLPDHWEIKGKDTITLYMKEMLTDTVNVALRVNEHTCDTLQLTPFKKKETRGRQRNHAGSEMLTIKLANAGEVYKPMSLNFSYPIQPTEPVSITLIGKKKRSGNDTIRLTIPVPDSLVTSLPIKVKLEEKVPYTLIIRDSAFAGYNGAYNDSTLSNFTSKSAKDYGSLRITYNLPNNSYQYIAQLIDNQGRIIQTNILRSSEEIFYQNLIAGSYRIKVMEDRNLNSAWDTGNYREKVQPERIVTFPKPLTVRGYWELEETFEWK